MIRKRLDPEPDQHGAAKNLGLAPYCRAKAPAEQRSRVADRHRHKPDDRGCDEGLKSHGRQRRPGGDGVDAGRDRETCQRPSPRGGGRHSVLWPLRPPLMDELDPERRKDRERDPVIEGRHHVGESDARGEPDQRAQSLCKAERAADQGRGLVRANVGRRPLTKGCCEGVGR